MNSTVLWLFNDMLSLKTDVNVPLPTVRNKPKKSWKNPYFMTTWKPLSRRAESGSGAGSGSADQELDRIRNSKYGFKDPDPYKNVTDPDYCSLLNSVMHTKTIAIRSTWVGFWFRNQVRIRETVLWKRGRLSCYGLIMILTFKIVRQFSLKWRVNSLLKSVKT
jgi:hypothetical protein